MLKQKFDPELASEMEWSECILAASIDDKDAFATRWKCSDCDGFLRVNNHVDLADTAQEFLDRGWKYRRTRTGIDALCPHCKNTHKK